ALRFLRTSSSFFLLEPATGEMYTLSLHDALPIYDGDRIAGQAHAGIETADGRIVPGGDLAQEDVGQHGPGEAQIGADARDVVNRSEEHTSELQSLAYLVCRLLLEKKKRLLARAPR